MRWFAKRRTGLIHFRLREHVCISHGHASSSRHSHAEATRLDPEYAYVYGKGNFVYDSKQKLLGSTGGWLNHLLFFNYA